MPIRMTTSRRAPRNRRISSGSLLASFAERVSGPVLAVLKQAESDGLRGDTDAALAALRASAAALRPDPDADADRVAIGELAMVISAWSSQVAECHSFLEHLAETVSGPAARAALYFHLGRSTQPHDGQAFLSRALDEFTIAGDVRGRAVTLAQLCWPAESGAAPDYRVRLGREALDLALRLDDPWAIAFCAGRLAGCETYLDHPDALLHWRQAAEVLPSSPDSITSEIASLNQFNWASTAIGHGDHGLARQVISDGKVLAHGRGWARKFTSLEALVAWRCGDVEAAVKSGRAAQHGKPDRSTHIGAIALAGCALEREGRPDTAMIDEAVEQVSFDEQMSWLALAVQAELRVARREPGALRDVPGLLDQARRMHIHFGWEDAALVMARHSPREAGAALEAMTPLWPTYRRGVAVRAFVGGLVAGHTGYEQLCAAASAFLELPEPVTAGRALHAAAKVAPSVAEGNRLRLQALDLFSAAGAERSTADVLRDRTLHRSRGSAAVPESQRRVTTAALTPREREVATLAAKGLSAQEIADSLHVSLSTARQHLLKVRAKFGGVPKRRLTTLLDPTRLDD